MIQLNKRVSHDVEYDFYKNYDKNIFKEICRYVNIRDNDETSKRNLIIELSSAYMLNKPDFNSKLNSPSKQIEKIESYLRILKKTKDKLIKLSPKNNNTPYQNMEEDIISLLGKLQRVSNTSKLTNNIIKDHSTFKIMDMDREYLKYEFDKKLDNVIKNIKWLEECFSSTIKIYEDKNKNNKGSKATQGKGRQKNTDFFNQVHFIYCEFTKKTPKLKKISYAYDNRKDLIREEDKNGNYINFIQKCFSLFKLNNLTDSAIYQKLKLL